MKKKFSFSKKFNAFLDATNAVFNAIMLPVLAILLFFLLFAKMSYGQTCSNDAVCPSSPYELAMLNIKYSEGIRLTDYLCAAGVSTSGWGTTDRSISNLNDANDAVYGKYASLHADTRRIYPNLDAYQVAAIVSFRYNVGKIGPNLDEALKRGYFCKVPDLMRLYVHAGGKRLRGLKSRRDREIIIFNGTCEQRAELVAALKSKVIKKIVKAKTNG